MFLALSLAAVSSVAAAAVGRVSVGTGRGRSLALLYQTRLGITTCKQLFKIDILQILM